jgi:uncharacterized membrane protein
MIDIEKFVLFSTILFTGIMAGLFFAYSFSVTAGLGKMSDKCYIQSMQSINREIQNPVFFLVFFGVMVLLPICTYFNYKPETLLRFYWLLFATCIYIIGVFVVTATINVPLNTNLDAFDVRLKSEAEFRQKRMEYEPLWNRWNRFRTLCSFLSFCAVTVAGLS